MRPPPAPTKLAVGIALTTEPEKSRSLLAAFAENLGAAIDLPTTAHGMWHYHHLLEALAAGDLDIVWLPPILALRATARGHCLPIALPVRHGASSYSTALFTREDSPVRSIDDLRAVSAAWVDRQSAAGYLIIRALLRSRGVDLEQAFSREVFLGTHDAVAAAVAEGEVDVGATFVYLDALPARTDEGAPRAAGWGARAVHLIASAGPIPSDVIAVNKKLPGALRRRIQRTLVDGTHDGLAHAARRLLGAERFVAPDEAHLDALLEVLTNLEDTRGPAHTLFPPPKRV